MRRSSVSPRCRAAARNAAADQPAAVPLPRTGKLRAGIRGRLRHAAAQADEVNRIIYEQLCRGQILPASRQLYLDAVQALAGLGPEDAA